jgi:DNA ligase-4
MKFDLAIKFFNKFAETKGRDKSKLIRTFIGLLFKDDRRQAFTYSIIRLLLPAEDRERGNYGVKEKSIAVILKEALGLTNE